MKRYRYITLSLLLLLLSLSSLSAQKVLNDLFERTWHYQFDVKTEPSYCQNEGTMEIRLTNALWDAPFQVSQIERVEYDVKDGEDHSYTGGYKPAPAPTEALLIEQLPGRDDYHVYIRLIPKEGAGKLVKTDLLSKVEIENKYIALEVTQV